MHVLNHKGKYFSVRGPVNIARPIQGWPVIVQAGASDSGRQLAAETAEAVFTAQSDLAVGQKFYADVKGRMEKLGRARDHMKILPACFVVVGDTVEEAKAKRAKLDSLVNYANAIASLSIALGHDARNSIPMGRCRKSRKATPRRAGASAPSRWPSARTSPCGSSRNGSAAIPASPWSARRDDRRPNGRMARDRRLRRLTIMFPYLPGGLDDFVDLVIPELQRRGLFRREYEGATLRENLGLPRPTNRFFQN